MKIVPSSRLVGMDNTASGDATTNDRDGLVLMLHEGIASVVRQTTLRTNVSGTNPTAWVSDKRSLGGQPQKCPATAD